MERLTRNLDKFLGHLCQLYRASSKLPIMELGLREYSEPHAVLLQSRCRSLLHESHHCMTIIPLICLQIHSVMKAFTRKDS